MADVALGWFAIVALVLAIQRTVPQSATDGLFDGVGWPERPQRAC
jgi:hypothetical protein